MNVQEENITNLINNNPILTINNLNTLPIIIRQEPNWDDQELLINDKLESKYDTKYILEPGNSVKIQSVFSKDCKGACFGIEIYDELKKCTAMEVSNEPPKKTIEIEFYHNKDTTIEFIIENSSFRNAVLNVVRKQ